MRLPNLAALLPFRAIPEVFEGRLDSPLQFGWIQGLKLLLQALTGGIVEDAGVQQSPVGGAWGIIELRHSRSTPLLADELADRSQEVQLQTNERVEPLQRLKGRL